MNTIIDIIGASIIGGLVFLAIFSLNTSASMNKMGSDINLMIQQNAKTLADIIENDLRKVGYNHDGNAILIAHEKLFSFYSDIDSNGVEDVVTYRLGDTSEANVTENPSDRPLIITVNNDSSKGPSLGLTDLKFSYNNQFGEATTVTDSIRYIKVEIWVQSLNKLEGKYPFTYWEITVNPRNL